MKDITEKLTWIIFIIFIFAGLLIVVAMIESGIHNMKCEKEPYYYRVIGTPGLFTSTQQIETTKELADGIDYRCKK